MFLYCLTSLKKLLLLSRWTVLPLKIMPGKFLCFRTGAFKNTSQRIGILPLPLQGKLRCSIQVLTKLCNRTVLSLLIEAEGKLIFINHTQTHWRIDLLFVNHYRTVTKNDYPGIFNCSFKKGNSMKTSTSVIKIEDFFSKTSSNRLLLYKV